MGVFSVLVVTPLRPRMGHSRDFIDRRIMERHLRYYSQARAFALALTYLNL